MTANTRVSKKEAEMEAVNGSTDMRAGTCWPLATCSPGPAQDQLEFDCIKVTHSGRKE